MLFHKIIQSPVGELKIIANDIGLVAILWDNEKVGRIKLTPSIEKNDQPILIETEKQLQAYFSKTLKKFTIRLDFSGTDFQKKVWSALLEIPYGETKSYSEIARIIGHPKAVRAVGSANRKNPISIIAACHRVIGANGSLTGFAGGLDKKAILLKLESMYSQDA